MPAPPSIGELKSLPPIFDALGVFKRLFCVASAAIFYFSESMAKFNLLANIMVFLDEMCLKVSFNYNQPISSCFGRSPSGHY
jgi:hypothetical protein